MRLVQTRILVIVIWTSLRDTPLVSHCSLSLSIS